MNITAKLKAWLIANCGVKSTATDDEFRKAAGEALATGRLDPQEFQKLATPEETAAASEFTKSMTALADGMSKLTELLAPKKPDETADKGGKQDDTKATGKDTKADDTKATPEKSWYDKMVKAIGAGLDDNGETRIEVKAAHEQYSSTKSTLAYPALTKKGKAHPFAGQPVMDFAERGHAISTASDRDKAVAGAYAKFMIATAQRLGSRTFGFQSLPQHDKELLYYAMEEMPWGGSTDGGDFADIQNRNLTPRERKALIDDAVSGGLEAAPIVFDDMVIQAPLLNGELFPLVNVVPLDRGRRVEGVSTGTVTGSWGGVDDTAIALFNTASYVSAFDTTIFRWEGCVRIGLDYLSDTPIDFGAHFTNQYGERLLEDLDDVIAVGNGTTQPEGVTVKSGTTSVNFGAATSLGNYESLRFGVTKKEHKSQVAATAVFCGTETSYQRARAIPVGASDARRLGGMDYSSYQWMERPYKINESLTNAQIFYAILGRYRMYRRRGLTIRTSTEGDTLIRNNEMLIAVTARYGGQLERGAVAAVTSTAPV